MLMKILLTLAVIAGAALVLRNRNLQRQAPAVAIPSPSSGRRRDKRLPRFAAYGVIALMLVGSALFIYAEWRDAYQVVNVRVIDTRSGQSVKYQAYKGDIEERAFITTEGLRVSLAEVERLETGGN